MQETCTSRLKEPRKAVKEWCQTNRHRPARGTARLSVGGTVVPVVFSYQNEAQGLPVRRGSLLMSRVPAYGALQACCAG